VRFLPGLVFKMLVNRLSAIPPRSTCSISQFSISAAQKELLPENLADHISQYDPVCDGTGIGISVRNAATSRA